MNLSGRPWLPWAAGLLLTGLTLALHLCPAMNSMLNMDAENYPLNGQAINTGYLTTIVELHRTEPAFARRPCTTWAIDAVDACTGLGPAYAFIVTQFALLFVSGLLLYRLARMFGGDQRSAILAMIAYHASFTVLSAWFPPIYTYDEPLQYALLFMAVEATVSKRWAWFALAFTGAMCVRESSVLVLPSLFLFCSDGAWHPRVWMTLPGLARALAFVLPVGVFSCLAWLYVHHLGLEGRTHEDFADRFLFFEHNFSDAAMTWESFIYLYLAIGLPAGILFAAKPGEDGPRTFAPRYRGAFLLALVINSTVVLLCTKAREARLFALPLLFAWPLLGSILRDSWNELLPLRAIRSMFARWEYALFFVFVLGLLVLVSDHGWELSDGNASGNLWHEYFLLQSVLILLYFMARRWRTGGARA